MWTIFNAVISISYLFDYVIDVGILTLFKDIEMCFFFVHLFLNKRYIEACKSAAMPKNNKG